MVDCGHGTGRDYNPKDIRQGPLAATSRGGPSLRCHPWPVPYPIPPQRPRPKPPISVRVVRVIDGDTIEVCCIGWKRESVRYIGINTPETQHPAKGVEAYGKEAAGANLKLVAGKTVHLEFDVQRRDQYGRLLAYVYLEDGTFVNAWLVEHGYAQVMTVPPNVKYEELFLKLQQKARAASRGLWR